jgi:hypothetical protein
LRGVGRTWLGLVFALGALTISCLLPGSLLTQAPPSARTATIEAAGSDLASSNCAAVICNRGTPSAPAQVPTVPLVAAVISAAFLALVAMAVRRTHPPSVPLPTGNPSPLFRPPQPALSA